MENHDIITISKKGYISKKTDPYTNKSVINICKPYLHPSYNHWTIKEIYEQPKTLLNATNNGARILDNEIILGGINNMKHLFNNIDHIIVLGCGLVITQPC